MYQVVERSNII